jgi:adenine/guanine phosphoribosyltransferase-like PRPP-binding protein
MSAHEAAQWLQDAVTKDGVTEIVKAATRALKDVEFDTIVFRGMSGALIAPIVAHKMGKEIVMLRKKDEQTHSIFGYEGYLDVQRYVIIDDFVSTGETVAKIIMDMRRRGAAKFVGLYVYFSNLEKAGWYPAVTPCTTEHRAIFERISKCLSERLSGEAL